MTPVDRVRELVERVEMILRECYGDYTDEHKETAENIVRELSAALAKGEPVAWLHTLPDGRFFEGGVRSQALLDRTEAEDEYACHGGCLSPLYAAPVEQAASGREKRVVCAEGYGMHGTTGLMLVFTTQQDRDAVARMCMTPGITVPSTTRSGS